MDTIKQKSNENELFNQFFKSFLLSSDECICLNYIENILYNMKIIPASLQGLESNELDEYFDVKFEYIPCSVQNIIDIVKEKYNEYILDKPNFNEKIFSMLQDKNIVKKLLDYLVMNLIIVKNVGINTDDTYCMIPRCIQGRDSLNKRVNITTKNPNSLLLVTDLHIGNPEMEDLDLLQNVVDFSIDTFGTKECLALGDIFEGVRLDKGQYKGYGYADEEIINIFYNQAYTFYKKFPSNIKFIAFEGNHDNYMKDFLSHIMLDSCYLNYNFLSILKPNFQLVPAYELGHTIDLSNFKIVVNHNFLYNEFESYVKSYELDAKNNFKSFFRNENLHENDLFLFGHFHSQTHRTIWDEAELTKREYEVVPATAKINIGKDVAEVLVPIYNDKGIVESYSLYTLASDLNKRIYISRVNNYDTNYSLINKNSKKKI